MQMIRWIHFSDLHLGNDSAVDTILMRKKLPGYLSSLHQSFDYAFCSGDVREWSASYHGAPEYIRQICGAAGTPLEHLFVVPGNHDVRRGGKDRKKLIEKVTDWESDYYRSENGVISETDLLLLKSGQETFRLFVSELLGDDRAEQFLRQHFVCTTEHLNILHLDTTLTYGEGHERDLVIGTRALLDTLEQCDPQKPTVILTHYSFDFLKMSERDEVETLLHTYGAQLWLAGHEHSNLIRRQREKFYECQCGNLALQKGARSCFLTGELDLDTGEGQISVHAWYEGKDWEAYPFARSGSDNDRIYPIRIVLPDSSAENGDPADEAVLRRKTISENKIVGYTAYEETDAAGDGLLRYHFSRGAIPFCGREKELSELQAFVGRADRFLWWAITGQAGSGKSRLAMELLYRLPEEWFGFFLNDEAGLNDIDSFTPVCHTLVIIDYVAGRDFFVAGVLSRLKSLFSSTEYRLRVLLLERDNQTGAGSWYAGLLQRLHTADAEAVKAARASDRFLDLGDMERADVEAFIRAVCTARGVREDCASELYEAYGRKCERLRFRPLYLQIFVEAWIDHGCTVPQYESYSQLLIYLLSREQTRWLAAVDGNHEVCNAVIRLMIRANISGKLELSDIPELYKSDRDTVLDYIKRHSFSGRQRQEQQDTLIDSFCQNIDHTHAVIAPQFPDIIKEFMFSYYVEEGELPAIMKEIWQHSASDFQTFIMRCMMDFPEQTFFTKAINAYQVSYDDPEALAGRLNMLAGRLIQKGEDPQVYWDILRNEYHFWNGIVVPEDGSEQAEILAVVKLTGLYRVAQNLGGWSIYDLNAVEEVVDQMLSVRGGKAVELLKKTYLQEHITELSEKGFLEEAKRDREKLDALIAGGTDELDTLLRMQNGNNAMMEAIQSGEWKKAQTILRGLARECNMEDLYSVRALAFASRNLAHLSLLYGQREIGDTGCHIAAECGLIYPEDPDVKAHGIVCRTARLQRRYFDREIDKDGLRAALAPEEEKVSSLRFDGSASDEALDFAWGIVRTCGLNFANEEEIRQIIAESDGILEKFPHLTTVASTHIQAVRALHRDIRHDKVPHDEVERLYRYVRNNPSSESVRQGFFDMLKESVDAGRLREYLSTDILREAISDARYHPMMGSGIPGVDRWVEEISTPKPYVRKRRKIGRNEPCPCGSGKKFKKCCMDKEIYGW